MITTSESETPESEPLRGAQLTEMLDRLSLEQALRDFEIANARVVDLTRRLTTMNDELSDALTENARLKARVAQLRALESSGFFKAYRVLRGGGRAASSMLSRRRST